MNQNRDKTHCDHGHPFDEVNTYHRPKGGRTCRICQQERSRRYERARIHLRIRRDAA